MAVIKLYQVKNIKKEEQEVGNLKVKKVLSLLPCTDYNGNRIRPFSYYWECSACDSYYTYGGFNIRWDVELRVKLETKDIPLLLTSPLHSHRIFGQIIYKLKKEKRKRGFWEFTSKEFHYE